MGFWGIEVKPGKPHPYHSDNVPGRLHVTQATLGTGSSKERSVVQCTIGHKSPIFLCSLLPNRNESCSLNLEFDEDELVSFSVIGPRSIHLSGYFEAYEEEGIRDDYGSDSYGEEGLTDSEADDSDYSGFNTSDDYGSDFTEGDDEEGDFDMYTSSPTRKSGVVIEEIVDDEKTANENGQSKQSKKKNNQSSGSENGPSSQQIVVRGETGIHLAESEDEDGFPISTKEASNLNVQKPESDVKPTNSKKEKTKKKSTQDVDGASNLKRKVENTEEEGRQKKKKNNKKLKEQEEDQKQNENVEKGEEKDSGKKHSEEKKKKNKKNKKKGKDNEAETKLDQTVSATEDHKEPPVETEEKKTNAKSSKVRTYGNGLVVEELSMGKPDGKRATLGKKVLVNYIGKLRNSGKIFDSNVGKRPFCFRLGTGEVISGWDVGVLGMRVGDKRRLTIPPEMGYGSRAVGGKIPANSWLVFDVELVDVR